MKVFTRFPRLAAPHAGRDRCAGREERAGCAERAGFAERARYAERTERARHIAILTTLVFASCAFAHAFPDHSDPKVGASVATAPTAVKIWFTQEIEPAFSAIEVFDSDGKQVDNKDSHADDSDSKLLIVTLPPLAPGKYKVAWHVVSVDTHRTQGDFKFTVK